MGEIGLEVSDVGGTLDSTHGGAREYGECACEAGKRAGTDVRTWLRGHPVHLPKGDTMIYAIAVGTLCAIAAVVWRISRPGPRVVARWELESWERRNR